MVIYTGVLLMLTLVNFTRKLKTESYRKNPHNQVDRGFNIKMAVAFLSIVILTFSRSSNILNLRLQKSETCTDRYVSKTLLL